MVNNNPIIRLLWLQYALIEHQISVSVIFAAMTILDITYLHHQIDEVLNTENFIVLNWILLVDSLHKEPEFAYHF